MRKDYDKAANEITAVGPEIENAMAAFDNLLLENFTGDGAVLEEGATATHE